MSIASFTPTGTFLHPCAMVLSDSCINYFKEASAVFEELLKYFLTLGSVVPKSKFEAGVPGAFVDIIQIRKVSRNIWNIHQDASIGVIPSDPGKHIFTVIFSQNFPIEDTSQQKQVLIGTSIYN